MSTKSRLISGRVPVTTAANVAANRYQYLDLSSAEPNLGTGNTGDVLIYDSTFPGGRKWTAQAEIRGSIGETAYSEANTASANTLYLSGVDLAQNNRLTAVETNAQAAFNAANTKLSTSGGTITVLDIGISGHYNDGTNAHTGIIRDPGTKEWYVFEGYTPTVDANNNVNINDASFAKANVNADYFKGNVAFPDGTTQTTAATGIDSYARTTANTASANTIYTQGVDATQNTNITNINSLAQAAFNAANTVSPLDSYARTTANAAFTQANTATTLAQAAFNKANTSVDAVLTSTVDTFTGDGSTVAYTLSTTPATINYTTAVVGGVTQPRSAYSVIGTTLTFTSAPANTQIIEVTTIGTSNTTLYTVNNIISPFLLMGA